MNSEIKEPFFKRLIKVSLLFFVAITTSVGTLLLLFFIMILGLVFLVSSLSKESQTHSIVYGSEDATNTFVSLPITGVIVGDQTDISDPFGFVSEQVTYGYDVKNTLYQLSEDESIKGIVLEINSPGGTIYGANAIADGIEYYKATTGKPVVAFVSGLAASGGYWAAASSDYIIADMGTNLGSIGVIAGPFQYFDTVLSESGGALVGGVVTENGIETTYITAGTSKDLGNPYRRLTPDELSSLQTMVNREYETFVEFVSNKRSIEKSYIKDVLGAMVYDANTSVERNLANEVGSRESAYEWLAQQIDVNPSTINVIREELEGGLLKSLLQSQTILPFKREASLCSITTSHLVYFGDVSSLCY